MTILTKLFDLACNVPCSRTLHAMALAEEDVLCVPPGLALETSEVFVVDEEKCKIKIFESEPDPENDPSNHGATVLKQVSSREEMESLLRVS